MQTAIFDFKKHGFQLLVLHVFSLLSMLRLASHPELLGYRAFLCFLNAFLNLFGTGLIYATKTPKKIVNYV